MDPQLLKELLGKKEGVKLDFKRELYQIFHLDKDVSRRHWDEFIRDILGILNGNVGTQGEDGYLIIGAGNQINSAGGRDLFDVGKVDLNAKEILDRVNPACEPPVPDLMCDNFFIEGKRVLVVTIPPSPHLHETTRPLETKNKKTYTERTVFVRRGESVLPATTAEIIKLLEEKKRYYAGRQGADQHPGSAQPQAGGGSHSYSDTATNIGWTIAPKTYIRPSAVTSYLENILIELSELDTYYIGLSGLVQSKNTPPSEWPRGLIPTSFRFIDLQSEVDSEVSTTVDSIESAMEIHHRFVLLGSPGSGKTRTLMKLQLDTAKKALNDIKEKVPVLIKLAHWPEHTTEVPDFLSYECRLKGLPELHFGRLLILLDGLNEMSAADYVQRVKKLDEWVSANPSASVIISCRERDYREREKLTLPTVQVSPLDESRILLLMQAYLGTEGGEALLRLLRPDDQARRSPRDLIHLAKNPYLLTMIVYVYKKRGALPASRGQLFQMFVRSLYGREEERHTTGGLTYADFLRGLSSVAFTMQKMRSATAVESSWASAHIPESIPVGDLWNLGAQSTVLDFSADGNIFQFSHQLLLEYFAAEWIHENLKSLNGLIKKPRFRGGNRRVSPWDEVVFTVVGISDPNVVLPVLSGADPFLTVDCLRHISTNDEVSAETLASLTNVLIKYFESGSSEERSAAVRKLADMGSVVVPHLIPVMDGGSAIAKRAGIEVLAELDDPTALDLLIKALNDPNRWVRREAADILGNFTMPKLDDVVTSMCKSLTAGVTVHKETPNLLASLCGAGEPSVMERFMDAAADDMTGRTVAQAVVIKGDNWAAETMMRLTLQSLGNPTEFDLEKSLKTLVNLTAALAERINLLPQTGMFAKRLEEYSWVAELRAASAELQGYRRTAAEEAVEKITKLLSKRSAEFTEKEEREAAARRDSAGQGDAYFGFDGEGGAGLTTVAEIPDEVREVRRLLKLLGDPSVHLGKVAVKELAAMGSVAVETLISVLRSRNSALRRRAPRALAKIGDPKAVQPLTESLRDMDGRVRVHATMALLQLGDISILPLVVPLLQDERPDVRLHAVKCLRALGDDTYIRDLQPLLEDQNIQVRMEAAHTLGLWKYEPGINSLVSMLGDTKLPMNVRASACSALGKVATAPQALSALCAALSDAHYGVRVSAASAIGRLGDSAGVPMLIRALEDPEILVRRHAVMSLGLLRDCGAVDPLTLSLGDEDDQVRLEAINALGLIGDVRALTPLSNVIGGGDVMMRRQAVISLSHFIGPVVTEIAARALNDQDQQVRILSMGVIGRNGREGQGQELVNYLADGGVDERRAAASALGLLQDPCFIEPLTRALDDEDKGVRVNSLRALGVIGQPECLDTLLKALDDEDSEIRAQAASAMGDLGQPTAIPHLMPLVETSDRNVAEMARQALDKLWRLE